MPLYPLCISRSRDVPNASDERGRTAGRPMEPRGRAGLRVRRGPVGGFKPLQHAAALEAIHRRIGVLPMRFGAAWATNPKSVPCCKHAAASCSTVWTASTARVKWGCGLHCRTLLATHIRTAV